MHLGRTLAIAGGFALVAGASAVSFGTVAGVTALVGTIGGLVGYKVVSSSRKDVPAHQHEATSTMVFEKAEFERKMQEAKDRWGDKPEIAKKDKPQKVITDHPICKEKFGSKKAMDQIEELDKKSPGVCVDYGQFVCKVADAKEESKYRTRTAVGTTDENIPCAFTCDDKGRAYVDFGPFVKDIPPMMADGKDLHPSGNGCHPNLPTEPKLEYIVKYEAYREMCDGLAKGHGAFQKIYEVKNAHAAGRDLVVLMGIKEEADA